MTVLDGNPLSADQIRCAANIERAKRTEQQIRAIVRDELSALFPRKQLNQLLQDLGRISDLGGDFQMSQDEQPDHAVSRLFVERSLERLLGTKVVDDHGPQHRGGGPGVGDVQVAPGVSHDSPRSFDGDRDPRADQKLESCAVTREQVRAGDSDDVVGVISLDTLRDRGDASPEIRCGLRRDRDLQAAVMDLVSAVRGIERHLTGHASPSVGVVDNPTVGAGAPGAANPASAPGATTQTPESDIPPSDEGYRPAADTSSPPVSAAGHHAPGAEGLPGFPFLHELHTEEFDRTNESNYDVLRVTNDSIVERVVRGGAIVSERELDAIPKIWPQSRRFWGPNR